MAPRPTLGISTGRVLRVVGTPIVKPKSPPRAPEMSRLVRTVTRSPGVNGRPGRKLAPSPSEWARSVALWAPLREPFAVTRPMADGAPPRRLICVPGPAVRVPGEGNTENVAAEAA